jgi:hypothetical protein
MIYFNVNIRNPYWADRFKNVFNWSCKTPFKNKYFEFEIIKIDNLFRVEFEVTTMQDHAGLNMEIALLGYQVKFTLYDCRHWNYEENRWYRDNENQGYE